MEQVEQAGTKGKEGNTTTSFPRIKARKWCMTWNNYTEEEYLELEQVFKDLGWVYIIGKEVGKSGTPHLQIYCEAKNPVSFEGMKKRWPKCHIEKAKGSREENKKYCSKENAASMNIPLSPEELYDIEMKQEYEDCKWYPWQEEILNLIESPPDKRKVHWYWEETGNVGKSFLCKYLDWKYDAIIANGKQSDVFNQYKDYLQNKKKQPKVALIDIPRSHKDYICYSTFEKIKDGLFYSGKYEGGKLRLTKHHLIIFANFEPDIDKLSLDRWDIHEIK